MDGPIVNTEALNAAEKIKCVCILLGLEGLKVISFKMGTNKPVVEIEDFYPEEAEGEKGDYRFRDYFGVTLVWKK